ncbi:MAG: ATP-binding protein [Microthrixaceae bacterium]
MDIAHLLAELMENGAQYSPPEKTVDIIGHRAVDGGYVISISDYGVGMAPDRLEVANRLLASPPPVGLALSRSLGFVVAGTLANRHGITVHLAASASGGVTAEVTLPPVPRPGRRGSGRRGSGRRGVVGRRDAADPPGRCHRGVDRGR